MSKNHDKSEFNKNEPKPTCNTCGVCGAKEEFVLVRRPMQEAHFHPEERLAKRGEMWYR